MRNVVSIVCAMSVVGCMSADSLNAPPDYPAIAQGNLIVNLDISGDPSTGPSTYSATLDGFAWRDLAIGQNQFLVPAGNHTVALASSVTSIFSGQYQSWCTETRTNRYTGIIAGDAPTTVTFALDCPPLVGNGVLRLSYAVNGSGLAATELPVNVFRLNGPTVSSTVYVPSSKAIDITLPVGLYRVSTNGSGSCSPSVTFLYLGMPVRAVRTGALTAVDFSLTCK